MVQGLDQREVIQDPNQTAGSQPKQADSIPVLPVNAPRAPGLSEVGSRERAVADILGKFNVGFNDYIDKKKTQWQLEGQMAYASGTAEADLAKSGNKYTMEGFMTMKARTSANEWMQQAEQDILNHDHQMSTADYQKKLSEQFKELTSQIKGDDKFTTGLMASIASESFPKLVAKQVAANNQWRQQETYNSRVSMLVSDASTDAHPEQLAELFKPGTSGLPTELERKSNIEAINLSLTLGKDNLAKAIGMKTDLPLSMRNNNPGNIRGADGKFRQFSSLEEGTQAMKNDLLIKVSGNSNAMKAKFGDNYQPTLANVIATWAPSSENDTNNYIDFVSKQTGISPMKVLSPADLDKVIPAMSTMEGNAHAGMAVAELLKQGYTPAEVESVHTSMKQYAAMKSNEFNKDRIGLENVIARNAEETGNLSQALDQIQQAKDQFGYTDEWAMRQVSQAEQGVQKFQTATKETNELMAATQSGHLAQYSPEKIQKALDADMVKTTEYLKTQQDILSPEEIGQQIRERRAQVAIENNVVDKRWSTDLNSAFSGQLLNKDGSIKQEALAAYNDYKFLASKGNEAYASKYLTEENKNLLALASTFDSGSDTTGQALITAAEVMTRKRNGDYVEPTVNPAAIGQAADKFISDATPGWWSYLLGGHAMSPLDTQSSEIAMAKANPVLKSTLTALTKQYMIRDPALTPEAAAQRAGSDLADRGELVFGNLLLGGKTSNIKEDMGLAAAKETGTVERAMMLYLRQHGEQLWSDGKGNSQWNKFQVFGKEDGFVKGAAGVGAIGAGAGAVMAGPPGAVAGGVVGGVVGGVGEALNASTIGQSIADAYRGVPNLSVLYDPDRKGFIVDIYLDKSRTTLANAKRFIPAEAVGNYYQGVLATEREHPSTWNKVSHGTARTLADVKAGANTIWSWEGEQFNKLIGK